MGVCVTRRDEVKRMASRFPLCCCSAHFDESNDHYITKPNELGFEDQRGYDKLVKFVDNLAPARWETNVRRQHLI